jgi:hypothetical protein
MKLAEELPVTELFRYKYPARKTLKDLTGRKIIARENIVSKIRKYFSQ